MKKTLTLLLSLTMLLSLAACGGGARETPPPAETAALTDTPNHSVEPSGGIETTDREGNPITLPETIETIISIGPSTTEIILDIGEASRLVAIDSYSTDIEGIDTNLPQFDMMEPDAERILSLEPDVVFVTGMSKSAGDDPFKPVSDAGVCVIYIPSSYTIEDIKEDILYITGVLGRRDAGEALVSGMEDKLEAVKDVGGTVIDKKKVYFEIAAAPYMYSFGVGVYLNEMLELIGAENIFSDQESWLSVADEQILSMNPDVILTTVYYVDDPVGDILARPGWEAVSAVANGDVYYIDANSSNRANHNIVKALGEMARAIYPELYS